MASVTIVADQTGKDIRIDNEPYASIILMAIPTSYNLIVGNGAPVGITNSMVAFDWHDLWTVTPHGYEPSHLRITVQAQGATPVSIPAVIT